MNRHNALSSNAAGREGPAVRLVVVEPSTTDRGEQMKIVAYVRVSTTEQVDHGQGLNIQRTAIRRWAKDNGHRIVQWCVDEGISGAKAADERPGLTDALTALRRDQATGLIIRDLDRLARAVTNQEAVLAEAWGNKGAHVFTVYGEVLRYG